MKYILLFLILIATPASAQTILGVQRGGTASSTLTGILKGNGTGAIQSAVAGVDYLSSLSGAASSTLLSDTNTWSGVLNTFSNAPKLSSLTGLIAGNVGTLYQVASSSLFGYTPEQPLTFNYPLTRATNAISFPATSTLYGTGIGGQVLMWNNVGYPTWYATSSISSGVISVTATAPLFSSGGNTPNITWTGLATTSQPSSSNLLVSNGTSGVYGVATSTLTATGPLTGSFTQLGSGGTLGCTTAASGVAGCLSNTSFDTFNNKQNALTATWPQILAGATLTFGGLSTSSPLAAASGLLYATGVNTLASVSTSSPITMSITGNAGTVTSGVYTTGAGTVFEVPLTLTAPLRRTSNTIDWTGLSTTTQPASSNLLVSNGAAGVFGVSTTTASCTGAVSCTAFTALGAATSINLNAITGVLGSPASAVPTAQATSTLYGTGTGGQVLGWSNTTNGIAWVATSTAGGGSGTVTSIVAGEGLLGGTITTSGTLYSQVGTSSLPISGNIPYWTSLGSATVPAKLGTIATSTLTCTGSVACTASTLIGTASSINLSSISSGVLGTAATGVPSAQATSTLYGTGTGGQVLGWNNATNGIAWVATSTVAGGTNYWTLSGNNIYNNNNSGLGFVGVGTSTPYGLFSLQATAGGQTPLFVVSSSTAGAATSTYMTIMANGFLDLGTAGMEIGSGTNGGVLGGSGLTGNIVGDIDDANSTKVDFALRRAENTTATLGSQIYYGRQRGTLASPAIVVTGDNLYTLYGYGYDSVDYAYSTAIKSLVEGTVASNVLPGVLTFSTANTLGTLTERMRIDSSGRLGIGTTTPLMAVDVVGAIRSQPTIQCPFLWPSNSAMTADSIGSATVPGQVCGSQMLFDMNTTGSIQPPAASVASGTPAYNELRADAAVSTMAFVKTPMFIGTATSTFQQGMTFSTYVQLPNVGTTVTTSSTSVIYFIGFTDTAAASQSTPGAYTQGSNNCFLAASSTANWRIGCTKAGVMTISDSTLATSTVPFKLTARLTTAGFTVYANDGSIGNVPFANVPVVPLNFDMGVGRIGTTGTATFPYMRVSGLQLWTQ